MITTYTRADGTACVRVCNFVHIRRKSVRNGNWILSLDYRDEIELLHICLSRLSRSKSWCLKGLDVIRLLEKVKASRSLTIFPCYFSVFLSLCLNLLHSSLRKSLLCHYVVMVELCVRLAGLHVKYRSLVPEFLWPGPGSLRHFVLLTLAAVVFLTSSTSLTTHQFVHSKNT